MSSLSCEDVCPSIVIMSRMLAMVFIWGHAAVGSTMDTESRSGRYRAPQLGRLFLLALPDNFSDRRILADMTFMTYKQTCTVTLLVPYIISTTLPKYKASVFSVTYKDPVVKALYKNQRVVKSSTGCTVRISSSGDITVQVAYSMGLTDVFILPPVDSYARRYTLISPKSVSLLMTIASEEMTRVQYDFGNMKYIPVFRVKCSWNAVCGRNLKAEIYLNGSTFSYVTTLWQRTLRRNYQSLTGTTVVADNPILVILGNRQYLYGRLSISPVLPVSMAGKKFLPPNNCDKATSGITIGLNSHNAAKCRLNYPPTQPRISFVLKASGKPNVFYAYQELTEYLCPVLTCSHPVNVVAYFSEDIDLTLFQFPIIPFHLWPNFVQFKKFKTTRTTAFRLHIMAEKRVIADLTLNDLSLSTPKHKWHQVLKTQYYYHGHKIEDDYITLKTTNPKNSFAAYIYSQDNRYSLRKIGVGTHLGNWYTFPEDEKRYSCKPDIVKMEAGDNIDNDCDGRFDEEIPDGKDDDDDGMIDEDVILDRVDGGWGPWQPWHCNAPCRGVGMEVRQRSCVNPPPTEYGNPCRGNETEKRKRCLRPDVENCPKTCPAGYFLPGCDKKCPDTCEGGICQRMTGRCFSCKEGFEPSPYCERRGFKKPQGEHLVVSKQEWLPKSIRKRFKPQTVMLLVPFAVLLTLIVMIGIYEVTSRTLMK